jgi:hypothetical protein
MAISDLTKEQLEQYAKYSTNWKEFMTKCGYTNYGCRTYLKKKIEFYDINITHFNVTKSSKRYTNEEIFKENSEYTSISTIKNKLIKEYKWGYECSSCKLSEWMEQKIPIEIDHINGIHTDNRIENLRFLCPNCHALTDTYRGKNVKNKEHSKIRNQKLIENKICKNCKNTKDKYSEYCINCHTHIKLHKLKDKIIKKCIDCDKEIKKDSERCISCYKKAKKEGNFEKEPKNIKNMKKCIDCEKYISKKSIRCRFCHYALMKSNSNNNFKEGIKNKCIDCDTIVYNKASRCVGCYRIHSRKVERPSYAQLIKDKETLSMVQIGKKYNVSDNTIRKWIKKYELHKS